MRFFPTLLVMRLSMLAPIVGLSVAALQPAGAVEGVSVFSSPSA